MYKEQMNKIKALIVKDTKMDKRKIENLLTFLLILVFTIIIINTITKTEKNEKNNVKESMYKELATNDKENEINNNDLEERIEKILETMTGVR